MKFEDKDVIGMRKRKRNIHKKTLYILQFHHVYKVTHSYILIRTYLRRLSAVRKKGPTAALS